MCSTGSFVEHGALLIIIKMGSFFLSFFKIILRHNIKWETPGSRLIHTPQKISVFELSFHILRKQVLLLPLFKEAKFFFTQQVLCEQRFSIAY